MKEKGRSKTILVYSLSAVAILLAVITTGLYHSRKYYQNQSRDLILRNDSIISVNIVLTNALKTGSAETKPSSFNQTKAGK